MRKSKVKEEFEEMLKQRKGISRDTQLRVDAVLDRHTKSKCTSCKLHEIERVRIVSEFCSYSNII